MKILSVNNQQNQTNFNARDLIISSFLGDRTYPVDKLGDVIMDFEEFGGKKTYFVGLLEKGKRFVGRISDCMTTFQTEKKEEAIAIRDGLNTAVDIAKTTDGPPFRFEG